MGLFNKQPKKWELDRCPFCGSDNITRRTDGVDDQQCGACWGYWSEKDLANLDDRHVCPRRLEAPAGTQTNFAAGSDIWRDRDGHPVCGYCGSIPPALFMSIAREGRDELGPTDKNYKVYVDWADDNGTRQHGKFYFQHLDEDQRREFVELLNHKIPNIGSPGYFYTPPFFVRYDG